MSFKLKYLKYKKKYIDLKNTTNQIGGHPHECDCEDLRERPSQKKVKQNSPPYVLKITGPTNADYYSFDFENKKYNILLFGSTHNYSSCYDNTYCNNCENEVGCYDLISYINELSKSVCVDIFHESNFNISKIKEFLKKGIVNDKFLLNPIYNGFNFSGYNNFKSFITLDNPQLYKNFIIQNLSQMLEIPIDNIVVDIYKKNKMKIIKQFEKSKCKYNNFFTRFMLEKVLDYIFGNINEQQLINAGFVEELFDKYVSNIESSIDTIYKDSYKNNIRFHFWDLRTMESSNDLLKNLGGFLPDLNSKTEEGKQYRLKTHMYFIELSDESYFDLIMYLTINQDTENGLDKFIEMKKIYRSVYKGGLTDKQINNLIFLNQRLFKKQFKKSIFKNNFEKFNRIFKKHFVISDIEKDYDLLYTAFTDLYCILRMFKEFDRTKILRGDDCDDNNHFQNIIYFGGNIHSNRVNNIIRDYFNIKPIVSKNNFSMLNTADGYRCVKFDKPYQFFLNDQLVPPPIPPRERPPPVPRDKKPPPVPRDKKPPPVPRDKKPKVSNTLTPSLPVGVISSPQ